MADVGSLNAMPQPRKSRLIQPRAFEAVFSNETGALVFYFSHFLSPSMGMDWYPGLCGAERIGIRTLDGGKSEDLRSPQWLGHARVDQGGV